MVRGGGGGILLPMAIKLAFYDVFVAVTMRSGVHRSPVKFHCIIDSVGAKETDAMVLTPTWFPFTFGRQSMPDRFRCWLKQAEPV